MKNPTLLSLALIAAVCVSGTGQAAALRPDIAGIRGYAFSEDTGDFDRSVDLFDQSSVLRNVRGGSALILVDVDLGSSCKRPQLGGQDAKDLLSGKKVYSRPAECDAPPGIVSIRYRSKHSQWQTIQIPLKHFFVAKDGHIRVPALAYRQSICEPMDFELSVLGVANGAVATARHLEFQCGE
jgi:hypothetical protein